MEEHINLMIELRVQLLAIGKNLDEDIYIALILNSLPESYNNLISGLESRPETNITLSKAKLIDEYRRRGNIPKSHETVLKTQNSGSGKANKMTIECHFCKKKGHMKKQCYKYKA